MTAIKLLSIGLTEDQEAVLQDTTSFLSEISNYCSAPQTLVTIVPTIQSMVADFNMFSTVKVTIPEALEEMDDKAEWEEWDIEGAAQMEWNTKRDQFLSFIDEAQQAGHTVLVYGWSVEYDDNLVAIII